MTEYRYKSFDLNRLFIPVGIAVTTQFRLCHQPDRQFGHDWGWFENVGWPRLRIYGRVELFEQLPAAQQLYIPHQLVAAGD